MLYTTRNTYICVHKYRENEFNVIAYCHNSCYLCPVAGSTRFFYKRWQIPPNTCKRQQGVRQERHLVFQNTRQDGKEPEELV